MPLRGQAFLHCLETLGTGRHASPEIVCRARRAPRVLPVEVIIASPCRTCVVIIARDRVPRVTVEFPRHARAQTPCGRAQRSVRAAAQTLHCRSGGIRDMSRGEGIIVIIPGLHGLEACRAAVFGVLQRGFRLIVVGYEAFHKKAVAVERLQSLARLPTRSAALDGAAHRIIILGDVPPSGVAQRRIAPHDYAAHTVVDVLHRLAARRSARDHAVPYIVVVTVAIQRHCVCRGIALALRFYQREALGRDHVSQVAANVVDKTCLRCLSTVCSLTSFANLASEPVGEYRHRSAVRVRIHLPPQRAGTIHPGGFKSATVGEQDAHGFYTGAVISAILRAVRMALPCRARTVDIRGAVGGP